MKKFVFVDNKATRKLQRQIFGIKLCQSKLNLLHFKKDHDLDDDDNVECCPNFDTIHENRVNHLSDTENPAELRTDMVQASGR